MNRRGFLGAILTAAVAPAIVRAASLMRWVPTESGLVVPEFVPDYETGLWEPTIYPADGGSPFIGRGSYTRVGQVVNCALSIELMGVPNAGLVTFTGPNLPDKVQVHQPSWKTRREVAIVVPDGHEFDYIRVAPYARNKS